MRIEENDCVCRAISKALDLDYFVVEKLLKVSADINRCEKLCVCCYHHLLEDIFKLPVRYCKNGETVGEIARMYPNNKVIIRIDGHLTMSDKAIIYDLFDCRNKIVDCYWIVS